jgi:hypothetical protein
LTQRVRRCIRAINGIAASSSELGDVLRIRVTGSDTAAEAGVDGIKNPHVRNRANTNGRRFFTLFLPRDEYGARQKTDQLINKQLTLSNEPITADIPRG